MLQFCYNRVIIEGRIPPVRFADIPPLTREALGEGIVIGIPPPPKAVPLPLTREALGRVAF